MKQILSLKKDIAKIQKRLQKMMDTLSGLDIEETDESVEDTIEDEQIEEVKYFKKKKIDNEILKPKIKDKEIKKNKYKRHLCAIDENYFCIEDKKGRLWLYNGLRRKQVMECPLCPSDKERKRATTQPESLNTSWEEVSTKPEVSINNGWKR